MTVVNACYDAVFERFRWLFLRASSLTVVSVCLLLAGCAATSTSVNDKKNRLKTASELELYQLARTTLDRRDYRSAIKILQVMERRFPFHTYSKDVQLFLIYTHYNLDEPELAYVTADRFIRWHAQHQHVDYAYYMKGVIKYPKSDLFKGTFVINASQTDTSDIRLAFYHFKELAERFPKSEYTPDALKRMEHLRNVLARSEMHVANYYFDRGAYLASSNRARYVLENFHQTPAVPDALAMMIQSYYEMGMHDLYEHHLQILRTNYPDYPALKNNGEFDFTYSIDTPSSWLHKLTLGTFGSKKPPGFHNEALYNPAAR